MNIKTDLSHLEHAQLEHSDWLDKLRQAVDKLATRLKVVFPEDRNYLPRTIHFYNQPGGGYEIVKLEDRDNWKLTDREKPLEAMLKLSDEIRSGWLKDVAACVEKCTQRIRSATKPVQAQTTRILAVTA